MMNRWPELRIERAREEAKYCVKNNATVRQVAKQFGVSKSVVHLDLTEVLPNGKLKAKVLKVLEENKRVRHFRGGEATRKKYLKLKENAE